MYTDYQYLVARQCFDYSNSLSNLDERSVAQSQSCTVDKSSLVVYSKSPDVSTTVINDLLRVARLPSSCASVLHLPRRDEGLSDAA